MDTLLDLIGIVLAFYLGYHYGKPIDKWIRKEIKKLEKE
jgi:hypothetical protein